MLDKILNFLITNCKIVIICFLVFQIIQLLLALTIGAIRGYRNTLRRFKVFIIAYLFAIVSYFLLNIHDGFLLGKILHLFGINWHDFTYKLLNNTDKFEPLHDVLKPIINNYKRSISVFLSIFIFYIIYFLFTIIHIIFNSDKKYALIYGADKYKRRFLGSIIYFFRDLIFLIIPTLFITFSLVGSLKYKDSSSVKDKYETSELDQMSSFEKLQTFATITSKQFLFNFVFEKNKNNDSIQKLFSKVINVNNVSLRNNIETINQFNNLLNKLASVYYNDQKKDYNDLLKEYEEDKIAFLYNLLSKKECNDLVINYLKNLNLENNPDIDNIFKEMFKKFYEDPEKILKTFVSGESYRNLLCFFNKLFDKSYTNGYYKGLLSIYNFNDIKNIMINIVLNYEDVLKYFIVLLYDDYVDYFNKLNDKNINLLKNDEDKDFLIKNNKSLEKKIKKYYLYCLIETITNTDNNTKLNILDYTNVHSELIFSFSSFVLLIYSNIYENSSNEVNSIVTKSENGEINLSSDTLVPNETNSEKKAFSYFLDLVKHYYKASLYTDKNKIKEILKEINQDNLAYLASVSTHSYSKILSTSLGRDIFNYLTKYLSIFDANYGKMLNNSYLKDIFLLINSAIKDSDNKNNNNIKLLYKLINDKDYFDTNFEIYKIVLDQIQSKPALALLIINVINYNRENSILDNDNFIIEFIKFYYKFLSDIDYNINSLYPDIKDISQFIKSDNNNIENKISKLLDNYNLENNFILGFLTDLILELVGKNNILFYNEKELQFWLESCKSFLSNDNETKKNKETKNDRKNLLIRMTGYKHDNSNGVYRKIFENIKKIDISNKQNNETNNSVVIITLEYIFFIYKFLNKINISHFINFTNICEDCSLTDKFINIISFLKTFIKFDDGKYTIDDNNNNELELDKLTSLIYAKVYIDSIGITTYFDSINTRDKEIKSFLSLCLELLNKENKINIKLFKEWLENYKNSITECNIKYLDYNFTLMKDNNEFIIKCYTIAELSFFISSDIHLNSINYNYCLSTVLYYLLKEKLKDSKDYIYSSINDFTLLFKNDSSNSSNYKDIFNYIYNLLNNNQVPEQNFIDDKLNTFISKYLKNYANKCTQGLKYLLLDFLFTTKLIDKIININILPNVYKKDELIKKYNEAWLNKVNPSHLCDLDFILDIYIENKDKIDDLKFNDNSKKSLLYFYSQIKDSFGEGDNNFVDFDDYQGKIMSKYIETTNNQQENII